MAINRRFIWAIEHLLHRDSELPIDIAFRIIKDFLLKVQSYHRREINIPHFEPDLFEIDLDTFLLQIPLQLTPIPDGDQCPVSFCQDFPTRNELEEHLRQKHPRIWENGCFHSEFHTSVASLLGVEPQDGNPHEWFCPLPECNDTFHVEAYWLTIGNSDEELKT
jgi:hypothetical protein